jgi:energy-coupling factor transporter ATP-binding protein EcfA2
MLAQYFHSMTDEKEALEALDRVGLKDRAGHLPSQLSGGEQQRVCIARALINDPKIVLADEPTGNLDAVNEEIVLRLLRELHQQGRTIVMVTHDPVVARLADRRIELHHGKIAAQEVFAMADDEQFDEVLEELFALEENGQIAEIGRMEVHGALPVSIAVEKMAAMGSGNHAPAPARSTRSQALRQSLPRRTEAGRLFDRRRIRRSSNSRRADISAPPTSSAAIAWPSASSPIPSPWTAKLKSSNRPASSSTYSRPKPPTRSALSSTTRSPAPTAPPFRPAPAADGGPNPGKRRQCFLVRSNRS